ncbi:DUF885 domain-containing protein [Sphingosinithalassobacter portus]|uniref:DUF885 domain-containing protein n=1 Tax=Stakelama portus TaxID=2676234 RepID=UPI000D6E7B1A|nr:DUF885 domain-containing protein [Sphingosinithalassobacter portus]
MFRTTRRSLLAGAGASIVAGTLPARAFAAAQSADEHAQTLIDVVAERYLDLFPESATYLGIDTDTRANKKFELADRSVVGRDHVATTLREDVAMLAQLDLDTLSPVMRINVDVAMTSYRLALDGLEFPYGDVAVGSWRNAPYVVVQNVGAYLDIPQMLDSDHKIERWSDADAYLSRMRDYADALDGETERLKIAYDKGVIAPDFLIDKTLASMDIATAGAPGEWGIVKSLAARTEGYHADYAGAAAKIAREAIAPALERQIAELKRHRAVATSDAGVWKFPDGEEYYAWALRAGTTTDMTPDEVHQMGLDQVAELHGRMDAILSKIGYTSGSVGERMVALAKDPEYLFPAGDEGRDAILAFARGKIMAMRDKMPQAFNTLVPGNFEVKRMPLEAEPGAPMAYGGAGSIDGSVPGRMWLNLRNPGMFTRYSLPDLCYHEAIPGHVWEGEYSHRLPLIRSLLAFNAFSEGWALYAEQLGDELGAYDDFEVGRLGYLQSIAFRACRLVVDTGLHAKRWTREHAIQWFHETNGSGIDEVTSEVERYCSWPGQACGYKVGHSEINRLRDKAKAEMGDRYSFKDYNDAVVTSGNVPMTVLGRVVERYIAG